MHRINKTDSFHFQILT